MLSSILRWTGNTVIIVGLVIIFFVYGPLMVQEVTYFVRPADYYQLAGEKTNEILNINPEKIITPIDKQFGIVIPKINANSTVIKDVDPNNAKEYQVALSEGVAHALGSGLPNTTKNVFLFAHSAGNFYESSRYNAVFYLLSKLEVDDDIYLYYRGDKYHYKVTNTTTVSPIQVSYMSKDHDINTLTLMTCWPPGTTFKRLIVEAAKQ